MFLRQRYCAFENFKMKKTLCVVVLASLQTVSPFFLILSNKATPPMPDTRTPERPTTVATTVSTYGGPIQGFSTVDVHPCNKASIVQAVADGLQVSNVNATRCKSTGHRTSPEALVLTYCDIPSTNTWHAGPNVMNDCYGLAAYTPIYSVVDDVYNPDVDLAGVFIECATNAPGFKMVVQKCGQPPVIEYVTGSHDDTTKDPYVYHALL